MSTEEIEHNKARFGCWHIACGRHLDRKTAAAPWLEAKMRGVAPPIEPVRHIVEGARAYNSLRGLPDPHDIDYHAIRQSADRVHQLSRSYAALPSFDPQAVPHFQAMRDEVNHQFDHLTNRMGVRAEFVDHDPYRNAAEMARDLRDNKRIQVLKTAATGHHPFFSDEENDRFRAVHDAFGHAGTGRDFDGHGEEAAFQAHARMFSNPARGALTTETRGQNGYVIHHDEFGPQKIAVMHRNLWTPEGMDHTSALDWDEFRRVQDAQQRRYETPGNAGDKADRDAYFGLGEHGPGQERLVTPKDWITHSRTQTLDDVEPEFREHWTGYEMGRRHARTGIDHAELDEAWRRSPYPDHLSTGYQDGLEEGFGEGRVATLLDADGKPTEYFAKVAHVSGNQIDVLHCFAGEERFLTPDGPKSFVETAGTVQKVLTSSGDVHDGVWVDAPIRCYGEQEIWQVVLRRNKIRKTIRTTAGHRWLIGRPGKWTVRTTDKLLPDNRLAHLRPQKVEVEADRDGIRAGIFFGDGTAAARGYGAQTYGYITLWGEKAKELAEFFEEVCPSAPTETSRDNELTGLRFSSGMIGWTKTLPTLDASPEYLRGWLVGYIATDGSVDSFGKVQISSTVRENLEHVRTVALRLGIGTYGITTKMRRGFGTEESPLHEVAFVNGDLDPSWLLRSKHREAFARRSGGPDRFGWTVESVERTDEMALVYCAEVPDTESFALEDFIWTKNCPFCGSGAIVARSDGSINCTFCNSAFTVTVAPLYSAFPQSMGGTDYPWPGRPQDPAMMGGQPGDDGGFGGQLVPGNGGGAGDDDADGSQDDDAPPWADDADSGDQGDAPGGDAGAAGPAKGKDDDTEAEVGGKKKPPFGKKKSALFKTAHGGRVGQDDFLRHLAIATADRPERVAARVKAERTRG